MDTIASFEVDHNKLVPGLYVSRVDGDVTTYDLRFVRPNAGHYIPNPALHTVEHLVAVHVRNGAYGKHIVYFGPMGCRTGFYLLTTGLDNAKVFALVREAMSFVASYEGMIPGTTARECGNYLEHDLVTARAFCTEYAAVLEKLTPSDLHY